MARTGRPASPCGTESGVDGGEEEKGGERAMGQRDSRLVRIGDDLAFPADSRRYAEDRRARRCQSCQEVDCLDDARAYRPCVCRCHWSRG